MQHPLPAPTPRHHWTRHLAALLLAWVLAAAWGSVVQTQFNLQALVSLGVAMPAGLRAETTWQDLIGFGPVKGDLTLSATGDLVEAAANLFHILRQADVLAGPQGHIAFAPVPDHGLGRAINDRLSTLTVLRPLW